MSDQDPFERLKELYANRQALGALALHLLGNGTAVYIAGQLADSLPAQVSGYGIGVAGVLCIFGRSAASVEADDIHSRFVREVEAEANRGHGNS